MLPYVAHRKLLLNEVDVVPLSDVETNKISQHVAILSSAPSQEITAELVKMGEGRNASFQLFVDLTERYYIRWIWGPTVRKMISAPPRIAFNIAMGLVRRLWKCFSSILGVGMVCMSFTILVIGFLYVCMKAQQNDTHITSLMSSDMPQFLENVKSTGLHVLCTNEFVQTKTEFSAVGALYGVTCLNYFQLAIHGTLERLFSEFIEAQEALDHDDDATWNSSRGQSSATKSSFTSANDTVKKKIIKEFIENANKQKKGNRALSRTFWDNKLYAAKEDKKNFLELLKTELRTRAYRNFDGIRKESFLPISFEDIIKKNKEGENMKEKVDHILRTIPKLDTLGDKDKKYLEDSFGLFENLKNSVDIPQLIKWRNGFIQHLQTS